MVGLHIYVLAGFLKDNIHKKRQCNIHLKRRGEKVGVFFRLKCVFKKLKSTLLFQKKKNAFLPQKVRFLTENVPFSLKIKQAFNGKEKKAFLR